MNQRHQPQGCVCVCNGCVSTRGLFKGEEGGTTRPHRQAFRAGKWEAALALDAYMRSGACVCVGGAALTSTLEIMTCMREIERCHHNSVISTWDIIEREAAMRVSGCILPHLVPLSPIGRYVMWCACVRALMAAYMLAGWHRSAPAQTPLGCCTRHAHNLSAHFNAWCEHLNCGHAIG